MLIGCFTLLNRVRTADGKVVRRVLEVAEIETKNQTLNLKTIFHWNAKNDTFTPQTAQEIVKNSTKLNTLTKLTGWTKPQLTTELTNRTNYLKQIIEQNKLNYDIFSEEIRKYYVKSRRPN
jgi:hypothetical protein